MSLQNLTLFPRLELIGAPTPLEYLPRLSDYLGREIFIKRDDVTPLAMGGNKLRKLEFLAADALRRGGYADYRRRYPVQPCAPDGGGGG
jgi:D-cysteine desulfhydrase